MVPISKGSDLLTRVARRVGGIENVRMLADGKCTIIPFEHCVNDLPPFTFTLGRYNTSAQYLQALKKRKVLVGSGVEEIIDRIPISPTWREVKIVCRFIRAKSRTMLTQSLRTKAKKRGLKPVPLEVGLAIALYSKRVFQELDPLCGPPFITIEPLETRVRDARGRAQTLVIGNDVGETWIHSNDYSLGNTVNSNRIYVYSVE